MLAAPAVCQQRTDNQLSDILTAVQDSTFQRVIQQPDTFRLQIIYTQINRDKRNTPHFTHFYFNYQPDLYFNPASVVKFPLAVLSLEKLNALKQYGIDKYTHMMYDSSENWQSNFHVDTTVASGKPTIAHLIKRALLISENDPYNRMYQFVGQQQINKALQSRGFKDMQIIRQFLGLSQQQNRYTNRVRFLDNNGKLLYEQPPAYNLESFQLKQTLLGRAHYNRNDSLIYAPFDFTAHNRMSLQSLQQFMQTIMFPSSVSKKQRFNLTADDYQFIYRYLSQYPSETPQPKYDTAKFYDSYVKFSSEATIEICLKV